MRTRLTFWLGLALLVLTGTWGLSKIVVIPPLPSFGETFNGRPESINSIEKVRIAETHLQEENKPVLAKSNDFQTAIILLNKEQASAAANFINQQHSYLTQSELQQLKVAMIELALSQSTQITKQKNTLLAASTVFNDIDIWELLANAAIKDKDWLLAHRAQTNVSQLENSPDKLESQLKRLLFTAQKLHKEFESNNDEFSIKGLYENLTKLHPSYSRFQLELALSQLRLNETSDATTLLNNLSYDPEFGAVAKRALEQLNAQHDNSEKPTVASTPTNDIVIPLVAAGSSFLIDTNIEQRQVRLLLDTGASITALSSSLIQTLNLSSTNRVITLSTANGIRKAKLYRAKSLQIGRITLNDMLVAEIELPNNNQFQGLLGTDALNQVNNYSYLIDNKRRALIFQKF